MANPPLKETELLFGTETLDPSIGGGVRYVSGSLRVRDSVGVYDPRYGGGGYLTITTAKNQAIVTPGTYFDGTAGASTHPSAAPPSLPFNATLIAACAAVDNDTPPGAQWAVEICVNGICVATLIQPNGSVLTVSNSALSHDVLINDRVSVRNADSLGPTPTTTLAFPACTLVFRMRM